MFGKGPSGNQRFGKASPEVDQAIPNRPSINQMGKAKKRRFSMHKAVPGAGLSKFGQGMPASGAGEPDEDDQY